MILVLNAGSSSLKIEVFDDGLGSIIAGRVTNLGTDGLLVLGRTETAVKARDHAHALEMMLAALTQAGHPLSSFTAAAQPRASPYSPTTRTWDSPPLQCGWPPISSPLTELLM